MAKIVVPTSGTNLDPITSLNKQAESLGLTPIQDVSKFGLASETSGLNEFSNINLSDYGLDKSLYENDPQAFEALNEQRARAQGAGEQFLKGIGRVISTGVTEILKVPGYVGGALGSSLIDGDFIENTVDNAWVNAFQSLDETVKESIPIYLTKEVQEGGIGRKLMSSAWWSTTGADGIGFLLSMYAPGKILGALGSGLALGKGVQAIASSSKLGARMANMAGLANEAGQVTVKGINNLESFATVAVNTFVESAAEAANTFDNVKETYLKNNPNATEEEARKVAGDQAAAVMKANIGVLALSNYFDELTLFRGFNKADNVAKDSVFSKLTKDGVIDFTDLSKIEKYGFKEWIKKELPAKIGASFAKEGLFEEGLQTKIQQHYEKKAAGETSENFFQDVIGNYFDSLMNDSEMQESVVLGGILGGGASIVGSYADMKRTNEFLRGRSASNPNFFGKMLGQKPKAATKGFLDLANENFIQSTRSLKDFAELDENGNIKFETKQQPKFDPETNQVVMEDVQVPVYNQDKLKALMEEKENMLSLTAMYDILVQAGEKEQSELYKSLINFNRFLPFIQEKGGYEVLKNFIKSGKLTELEVQQMVGNTNKEVSEEERAEITNRLLGDVEMFNSIYTDIMDTTIPELYVKPQDKEEYSAWKQSLINRKMQLRLSNASSTKIVSQLQSQIRLLENSDSPIDQLKLKNILKTEQKLDQQNFDSASDYNKLITKEGIREDYEKFKNDKELEKQQAIKEQEDLLKKSAEYFENNFNTDTFKQSIENSGYDNHAATNKEVYVTDKDGNKGVLKTATNNPNQYILYPPGQDPVIVTDKDGNFTPEFKRRGWSVTNLEDALKEQQQENNDRQQKTQLFILKQLIDAHLSKWTNYKKQVADIEKSISEDNEKLNELISELDKLNSEIASNARKGTRTQKLSKKQLEENIKIIEDRINFLNNTRLELIDTMSAVSKLALEIAALQERVETENAPINVIKEYQDLQNIIANDNLLNTTQVAIDKLQNQITQLEAQRQFYQGVLDSYTSLITLFKLRRNSKELKELNDFFNKLLPDRKDAILTFHEMINRDPSTFLDGRTTILNQWQAYNNEIVIYIFDKNDPTFETMMFGDNGFTFSSVYDKVKDTLKYERSLEEIQQDFPLETNDIYAFENLLQITNSDITKFNKEYAEALRNAIKTEDVFTKYYAMMSLLNGEITQLYYNKENKYLRKNTDSSQQRRDDSDEVKTQVDLYDVFINKNLSSSPFTTTGVSVQYDENGKDKINDEGYPLLTDSIHQKNWFYKINSIQSSIQDYGLKVVTAKWDNSDEFQKMILENNPNASTQGEGDLFVFLVDKNDQPVRVENQDGVSRMIFTSLTRPSRLFPDSRLPLVKLESIVNDFLLKNSITTPIDISKKDKRLTLNPAQLNSIGLNSDSTVQDLINKAIESAKNEYTDFYNGLKDKDVILPITGITRGAPLYRMDNNKKQTFKPLDTIDGLTLNDSIGDKALQGGQLKISTGKTISFRGQRILLPAGVPYLETATDIHVLNQRTINDNEAKVIMYLLGNVDANQPLNKAVVNIMDEDGNAFKYKINNVNITSPFNLFFSSKPGSSRFSIIDTLIHYGLKKEGKNKKGEVYINNNKVIYTTFNGESKSVSIADLKQAMKKNDIDLNDEVKQFYDFLLTKRFNVDSNLLKNNGKFAYPTFKNNAVSFDTSKTYYSFLLENVVTTTVTKKEGYPTRLQQNVTFGTSSRASKPVEQRGQRSNKTQKSKPDEVKKENKPLPIAPAVKTKPQTTDTQADVIPIEDQVTTLFKTNLPGRFTFQPIVIESVADTVQQPNGSSIYNNYIRYAPSVINKSGALGKIGYADEDQFFETYGLDKQFFVNNGEYVTVVEIRYYENGDTKIVYKLGEVEKILDINIPGYTNVKQSDKQNVVTTVPVEDTPVTTDTKVSIEYLGTPEISKVEDGDLYQFKTKDGLIGGVMISPTEFRIDGISANEVGKGQGSKMFESLILYLKSKGVTTLSTVSAGEGAVKMHNKAVDKGLITKVKESGRFAIFSITNAELTALESKQTLVTTPDVKQQPQPVQPTEQISEAKRLLNERFNNPRSTTSLNKSKKLKVMSPEALLEKYIENKIVQKNCE